MATCLCSLNIAGVQATYGRDQPGARANQAADETAEEAGEKIERLLNDLQEKWEKCVHLVIHGPSRCAWRRPILPMSSHLSIVHSSGRNVVNI